MNLEQKTALLENSRAHFAADMLLKQTYGRGDADAFKGCSVGCHLHQIYPDKCGHEIDSIGDKHAKVADFYGYPEWLALLQDTVFEGLPNGESAKWHVLLAEALHALPDDYDWQAALHRVHIGILRISYRTAGEAQAVVQAVIDLHEQALRGEAPDPAAWSAAWLAAWSAATSAAWLAATSAAWSAANSAARSAAWLAATSAARSAAYRELRDTILAALTDHTP